MNKEFHSVFLKYLQVFPEHIKNKLINNYDHEFFSREYAIHYYNRKINCTSIIICAFNWSKSPEGHMFWSKYNEKFIYNYRKYNIRKNI